MDKLKQMKGRVEQRVNRLLRTPEPSRPPSRSAPQDTDGVRSLAFPAASKTNENLSFAWSVLTQFSHKVESFLDGTPFKTPVAAINVLIDLAEVHHPQC
jgi:hypothetical protein